MKELETDTIYICRDILNSDIFFELQILSRTKKTARVIMSIQGVEGTEELKTVKINNIDGQEVIIFDKKDAYSPCFRGA